MAKSSQPGDNIITYQYREKTSPCFLWTLVLAPCLMPAVWWVSTWLCYLDLPYVFNSFCHQLTHIVWLTNRKYHVTLTSSELSFGFSSGCMQITIDRSTILEVERIEHINGFLDWGGYGIRKQLPSWDTGYIARNGPGVRIKIQKVNGKGAYYTFSCHDPDEVFRILNGNWKKEK